MSSNKIDSMTCSSLSNITTAMFSLPKVISIAQIHTISDGHEAVPDSSRDGNKIGKILRRSYRVIEMIHGREPARKGGGGTAMKRTEA